MISSLAPPKDLMPPRPLTSSAAISAPMRKSWPCRAHGPDSGAIIAILTDFACARPIAGIASAPAERARPLVTARLVSVLSIICSPLPIKRGLPRNSSRRCYVDFLYLLDPFLAEIGFDHVLVADDLLRLARGNQP